MLFKGKNRVDGVVRGFKLRSIDVYSQPALHMCVLPVLGYKPITSYFSRAPSSTTRKRKETSQVVNAAVKRQRPSLPSTSGEPTKHHAEEEVPEGDGENNYDHPSTEVVGLPLTPLPRPPRKKKGIGLPAPPIPSSQSRTVDELEDLDFPLVHPAALNTKSSGDDHKFARRMIPDRNLIVESSQSQYLVMDSPRKQEKEPRIRSSFSAVDPVPSSQSQEEELTIPCKFTSECVGTLLPYVRSYHCITTVSL